MHKLTYIMVLFVLIGAVSVMAASSKLEIDKIEITSDGETVKSTSSSSGSFDVDPGQELRIKIKLENLYDDDTDNDIDDVRVTALIEDIDDGDEIDDSETVDVRAGGTKSVTLQLKIPNDASSYESYDLEIDACGDDQNGTEHCDSANFDIDVDREEHELVFEKLQMSDVYCEREGTIRIEIHNLGEEEEEDVELKVISDGLGTLYSDRFDITSIDDDEDDNIYSVTKRLDLDGIRSGTNTLRVRVEYDDGLEVLEKEIDFRAEDCETRSSTAREYEEDYDDYNDQDVERYTNRNRDLRYLFGPEEQPVVLQMPPPTERPPQPPRPAAPKESALSLFVLTLANIAVIIFIILLLLTLYNKMAEKE
ncbi:hypothetical protein KY359_00760 [Candidatus Woesearchaeota archaeon]|nr:hypothetical protein [Candidatus Woesearchaeota archaeon]